MRERSAGPYRQLLRFAHSVHVMPIVCSRAFVLAFVLFHDNRFASALATTGLHLVGIAGVVERFAVLENMTGRHGMRWYL